MWFRQLPRISTLRLILLFQRKFYEPGKDIEINIARLVCCTAILYKLLSRDFSFYGFIDPGFFTVAPADIYKWPGYTLITGSTIVTQLLTFHFVHWLLPYPGPVGMFTIQAICGFCLFTTAIFGRGPWRCFSLMSLCLLIYLWGFMINGGHEVDSMSMYFGILLVLNYANYRDQPLWGWSRLCNYERNARAGSAKSLLILVFVYYYFASGVKKISDITIADWFRNDFSGAMILFKVRADEGFIFTPYAFLGEWFSKSDFILNGIMPAVVYLSHLTVPLIFVYRNLIIKYALFYSVFHFLMFYVGISFLGYIYIWLCILPYSMWLCRREVGDR